MLKRMVEKTYRHLSEFSDRGLRAELIYLKPMAERPINRAQELGTNEPRTNAVYEPHAFKVRSMRRLAVAPELDVQGFTLVNERSTVMDFYDEAQVRRHYYREVERLVKKVTGASRVVVIDHITRRRPVGADRKVPGKSRAPVVHVHVDYTPNSAEMAVQEAGQGGRRGRVQVINVWRPIRGPLIDMPLALCDARTVEPNDLVTTDMVYPGKVWETYSVTSNPRHRWYYAPSMLKDEALLFKCFDSKEDGRARFTPHAAFFDRAAPVDALPRESIEVRTLVFD
jgi:hypothetical protein